MNLFFIFLFFLSCQEENDCPTPQNINSGIIVSEANEAYSCIVVNDRTKGYVITKKSDVDSIETLEWNEQCNSDTINFDNYSLLGHYASGTCSVSFIRKVEKDEVNSKYIYTIKIQECGLCEKRNESMNWVLVPALPKNYGVEFIIL